MEKLFILKKVDVQKAEAVLKSYNKEVVVRVYLSAHYENRTMLTILMCDEKHQLLSHIELLNNPINELCLFPIIDEEYLSFKVSGEDLIIQFKNKQDEEDITVDLFTNTYEFLGRRHVKVQ